MAGGRETVIDARTLQHLWKLRYEKMMKTMMIMIMIMMMMMIMMIIMMMMMMMMMFWDSVMRLTSFDLYVSVCVCVHH